MYPASILKTMLGQATTGCIEAELIPVDRIMQRWAAASGSGLPSDKWDDTPKAKPPPLDDDTALVVDRIVLSCPKTTMRILAAWYLKPLPTKVIAEELSMSPRSLEKCWKLSLNFLRWKFEESGNKTLDRLLRIKA